jgi:hypothetical protein
LQRSLNSTGQFGAREYTLITPYMVSLLMDRHRWAEAEPFALRLLACATAWPIRCRGSRPSNW